ncbi:MAG: hypothetical protein JWQ32_1746 [Marmoricola sp.]|nr:hypothetical protein [Marmoricola sp.]
MLSLTGKPLLVLRIVCALGCIAGPVIIVLRAAVVLAFGPARAAKLLTAHPGRYGAAVPQASQLVVPTGGHNDRDYGRFLGESLIWASRSWVA